MTDLEKQIDNSNRSPSGKLYQPSHRWGVWDYLDGRSQPAFSVFGGSTKAEAIKAATAHVEKYAGRTPRSVVFSRCSIRAQVTTTNMNINLEAAIKRIKVHGPDRIVINTAGVGARPKSTITEADIIFIREDGWSLGAPQQFEAVAYKLWQEAWIAFMRKGDEKPIAIEHYCPSPEHPCPRCGSDTAKRLIDNSGHWERRCTHCTWSEFTG